MLAAPGALRVSEWGEQDREDTFCEPAILWDSGSVVTTPVVTWRRKERTEGQPGKRQFLGKEHKGEGAAGAAVEWAEAEEIDL